MIVPGTPSPMLMGVKNFPKVRAQQSGNKATTTTTTSVTIPTVVAGDIILIIASAWSGSSMTLSVPAGYTRAVAAGSAGEMRAHDIFWKVADGSETSVTITGSANNYLAWNAITIMGGQSVEAVGTSGVSSAPDSPSLSPSWGADNTLWYTSCGIRQNPDAVASAPSGYSGLGQDAVTVSNYDHPRTAWASRNAAVATENPAAWGGTAVGASPNGWAAATIAIRPS